MIFPSDADVEDKITAFKSGGVDQDQAVPGPKLINASRRTLISIALPRDSGAHGRRANARSQAERSALPGVVWEDSPLAVIVYDADAWTILETNAACTRMLGYPRGNWIGSPLGFCHRPITAGHHANAGPGV